MANELEESSGVTNPLVLIQSAIERGVDPDRLGKLMDLAERWEANRAATAFAAAVARFQSLCPVVFKGRKAGKEGDGLKYSFASYDDVMAEAGPVLAQCGLAVSYTTQPAAAGLEITCRVSLGIHTQETRLTIPIPQMKVNDTQKFGAAMSYAKRFAICAALNIVVTDEDDDAASQLVCVSQDQVEQLNILLEETGSDLARFLDWAHADSLDRVPVAKFPEAIQFLGRKQKSRATK